MSGLDPSDPRFEKAVHWSVGIFSKSRIRHSDDLDDIAQHVRERLLTHSFDGLPEAKLQAAALQAARGYAVEWWRQRYGRKEYADFLAYRSGGRPVRTYRKFELHLDTMPEPKAELTEQPDPILARAVHRALQRIPRDLATPLAAYYFREEHPKEIAARMGLSESRIWQLIVKARNAVGEQWGHP